jgi:hypothetical protein
MLASLGCLMLAPEHDGAAVLVDKKCLLLLTDYLILR